MKLALDEPEQAALLREIDRWEGLVSSVLLRVEALRACARYGSDYAVNAAAGLGAFTLVPIDDEVLDLAATLEPPGLRSLDALHLATALAIRDRIGVLVTYDKRLLSAAPATGLRAAAPV